MAEVKQRLPSLDDLAQLQSFNPKVFVSDEKTEQAVCNFVLSLAIVSNDLKNLQWGLHHLKPFKPPNEKLTRYLGEYAGFQLYLSKLLLSALHELLDSIEANKAILEHPTFQKTIKQLPKEFRKSWEAVVAAALGKEAEREDIRKALLMIRNKIGFHYGDLKPIQRSFTTRFLDEAQPPEKRKPFVSLGSMPIDTRFYFADAVIENYIKEVKPSDFLEKSSLLMWDINRALRTIVEKFIYVRGGAFRSEKEEFIEPSS